MAFYNSLVFSEIALETDEERVLPIKTDGQSISHFISGLLVLGASKAQNLRISFFTFVPQSISHKKSEWKEENLSLQDLTRHDFL